MIKCNYVRIRERVTDDISTRVCGFGRKGFKKNCEKVKSARDQDGGQLCI